MKRSALVIIAAFLAVLLIPVNAPRAVRAESKTYAQAIVRDAYFYETKNGSSVFAVPYTYCIEVLSEDGDWYYASYAADVGAYKAKRGYCLKSDFALLEGEPSFTYLYKTVTVTFSSNAGSSSLPVLNELNLEAAFYGSYQAGGEWYSYVYCQGSFGYIAGANDDYPLNALPSDKKDETGGEVSGGGKKSALSAGLISALVILALFVAVILMLHFTSKKAPKDA